MTSVWSKKRVCFSLSILQPQVSNPPRTIAFYVLVTSSMAPLDGALALFSALEAAQDVSVLHNQSRELEELLFAMSAATNGGAAFVPRNRQANQLRTLLDEDNLLQKAAAATRRQLELLTEHMQTCASSQQPLHARVLRNTWRLLDLLGGLPQPWLASAAVGQDRDHIHAKVSQQLVAAGGPWSMGQPSGTGQLRSPPQLSSAVAQWCDSLWLEQPSCCTCLCCCSCVVWLGLGSLCSWCWMQG